MKKTLALLLAVLMVVSVFAGCSKTPANNTTANTEATGNTTEPADTGDSTYTYEDYVSVLATNWNPHTFETNDDDYLTEYLRPGLYTFMFNDELHPVTDAEGNTKEPYTGYAIVPEMAAGDPVDVTEQVKADHPEFGIPESATSGYAYTIDLNQKATWDDGTPITADDYVESMKRLLDPAMMNYRATDYYAQNMCVAGAEQYSKGGTTTYEYNTYDLADLTVGEDGQYVNPDGQKMYVAMTIGCGQLDGDALQDYIDNYGEDYFDTSKWQTLVDATTDAGVAPLTAETLDALTTTITGNEAWGETDGSTIPMYLVYAEEWAEFPWENVGLYKSGDYQITLVLSKALSGFNLYYSLTTNWLVKTDLYDAGITESNGLKTTNYCSSVETTASYGPYKLASYQSGKALQLVRNENWYGYTDGQHEYVDPTDGQTYQMYSTDVINCQVVEESATAKMMFLKGQLMSYALTADDMTTYRQSEYAHNNPKETVFFLILNGYKDAINNREAASDFDQKTTDLQTMTLLSFRKAVAVTYDKELFAATISPARSGAYGIIGNTYIYDPETGATYRSTDQAKQVLCDFYSVDTSKYANLDEAVASITGYDPEAAKELYKQAFDEAIAAGYITDEDGDGISDQTVTIEYCMSVDSDFMTKTVDYLNEKMAEVTTGTPFAGKVKFVKSAPYGNDWNTKIKNGLSDTVLAGWTGSKMNPFSLTDLYVNPSYQYDASWFVSDTVDMTLTVPVNGTPTEVTMNIHKWSDALNGTTVNEGGVDYNFGEGQADVETRLSIMAGIEGKVLETYDYLPMLQDGSIFLLTQKAYYVVDEFNPVLAYGGLAYLKYNYNDAEWNAYVTEQGGELSY